MFIVASILLTVVVLRIGLPDRDSVVSTPQTSPASQTAPASESVAGSQTSDVSPAQTAPPQPVAVEVAEPVTPVDSPPADTGAPGLLTFRGNATRSFHGTGPVPATVGVEWSYPDQAMCGPSTVGGETTTWCGTGWTGQPAVFERDGRTWVVFGAYDHSVHFVDAETGQDIIPPFPTGDIIKGSVTVDPDGYPIVYTGSRDGHYRAIAIDGHEPEELWSMTAADATGPTRWNDDWDGSGLIIDDRLLIGGENSRAFVVQLNRAYDSGSDTTIDGPGRPTLDPEVLWDAPGWDEELEAVLGDSNLSIENSVAVVDDTLYFSNSGGLVQGWDLSPLDAGEEPVRTFRFWMGDDTDASIVADEEGMLYVSAEYERFNARSAEVGQVAKLDPSRPDDALVWSFHDPAAGGGAVAGVWATPALYEDTLIVNTTHGVSRGLDVATGAVLWEMDLPGPLWSSPVVVDGVLVQGDCSGDLHAFDLAGRQAPRLRWTVTLGGCIESTPAVWDGRIYVGTRAGRLHAITAADGVLTTG